jgi:hypothetical protein
VSGAVITVRLQLDVPPDSTTLVERVQAVLDHDAFRGAMSAAELPIKDVLAVTGDGLGAYVVFCKILQEQINNYDHIPHVADALRAVYARIDELAFEPKEPGL